MPSYQSSSSGWISIGDDTLQKNTNGCPVKPVTGVSAVLKKVTTQMHLNVTIVVRFGIEELLQKQLSRFIPNLTTIVTLILCLVYTDRVRFGIELH